MKSALFFALLMLLNVQTKASTTTAFDGTWSVTLRNQEFKNPDGSKSPAWTQRFLAYVKAGSMHGERGTRGAPGWFEINGIIDPDGLAKLGAHGVTEGEKSNHGQLHAGTPYEYLVSARFKARHGSGKSVGPRVSTFTFARQ